MSTSVTAVKSYARIIPRNKNSKDYKYHDVTKGVDALDPSNDKYASECVNDAAVEKVTHASGLTIGNKFGAEF